MRPAPREAQEGFHYEAVVDDGWETPPVGTGRCRGGAGPGRAACGKPAVATLWRSGKYGRGTVPWNYCADHMYGHWIEPRVVSWRLVEDEP